MFEFDLRLRGLADKVKAGEYAIPVRRLDGTPSPPSWWRANPSSTS